jgi:PAS domain S-box-containing protein
MMKRILRFPLTSAATVLMLVVVFAAMTGELDLVQIPGVAGRIDPRAIDDILTAFALLVAAITVDVSRDRRAAGERARVAATRAEQEFRALFAANPLPMWIYDRTTLRFLEVNTAALQHYGYTRGEFLVMTLEDIRPAEEVERLRGMLDRPRETFQVTGSWRHRVKSGQTIDVEIASHTITFAGQTAALVVAQDVTERKRLERQFQQAQKMEAIGQLAGGVAHDFNNLLTVILGYCELLLAGVGSDPRRDDLREIQKAGMSAASLTAQLLAFSRKQLVEPRVLDFNAVIADMSRMLQRLVGEDIEILLHLAEDLGSVKADAGQLHQLLMNLVVNARDAMPSGGQLTIETGNIDLNEPYAGGHLSVVPGPYVVLAVSDTGTGMLPEVQARLFEPFFTTKEQGKGTGLGLASVYGIVKQSGGNIWVYSELGRGTAFKIYLPRIADAPESRTPARAVTLAPATETILVVEDNPALQALTARILRGHGYAVLLAGSPAEALNVVERHDGPIHLLLTDVVMPGQSGPSLAAHVAAERVEMRVLYMSGYAAEAIVRSGALGNAMTFLQKPFSPEALLRKVQGVLAAAPG